MADEKLTFLTEVELPPYCFMSEAVEWVAFGRVPQIQYHEDSSSDDAFDYRFYWREMPDNFRPSTEYRWFDRLEFESLGVQMDEDYFRAAEKCAFEDLDALPDRISEFEAREPVFLEEEPTINIWKKLADQYREKLSELGPLQKLVDSVEAGFTPHQEVACAKLFQLLVQGKVRSEALNIERWERLAEDDEYELAARFEEVPSDSYSLNHDWMGDEIIIGELRHVALRVKTADILTHRSFLLQAGKSISVQRFGAFYMSDNVGRTNLKAKKGRRSVVDWSAINVYLSGLVARDELPEGKENYIYELIAFAERELGKTPSRTAVQRNMASHLDAIYSQR